MRYAKAPEVVIRRTEPTPEELKQINKFAKRPLRADEVYAGEIDLANDVYDRTFERFPLEVLRDFAKTAAGKSLMGGHDYATLPLGLFYDARVDRGTDQNTLVCKYYMVRTPRSDEIAAQIEGGVLRYASIGFNAADLVCDICGASRFTQWCGHQPGQEYDIDDKGKVKATYAYEAPAEMMEGSIVYLGAQYGAELKNVVGMDEIAIVETRDAWEQNAAQHYAAAFQKSLQGITRPRTDVETDGKAAEEDEAAQDGEKPYPNEHACRLRDPGDFQEGSFRRTTRDHEGKQYSVIMGKLTGEDTMTEQAYRYAKTTWDADAAQSHCESHDGSFEAAAAGEAEAVPDAIKMVFEEKIGRVLSKRNEDKIREASTLLAEVLAALEIEKPAEETAEEEKSVEPEATKDATEPEEQDTGVQDETPAQTEEQTPTLEDRLSQFIADQAEAVIAATLTVHREG